MKSMTEVYTDTIRQANLILNKSGVDHPAAFGICLMAVKGMQAIASFTLKEKGQETLDDLLKTLLAMVGSELFAENAGIKVSEEAVDLDDDKAALIAVENPTTLNDRDQGRFKEATQSIMTVAIAAAMAMKEEFNEYKDKPTPQDLNIAETSRVIIQELADNKIPQVNNEWDNDSLSFDDMVEVIIRNPREYGPPLVLAATAIMATMYARNYVFCIKPSIDKDSSGDGKDRSPDKPETMASNAVAIALHFMSCTESLVSVSHGNRAPTANSPYLQ